MRSLTLSAVMAAGLTLAVASLSACAAEAQDTDGVVWSYSVQVSVHSYVPDGGLETHRTSAAGNASSGGTVGLGFQVDGAGWTAIFKSRREEERLLLKLSIESPGEETEVREIDLSDLKPVAIDLATASDGRVHYASVTPRLAKIDKRVEPFSPDALSLDRWQFRSATVLLNDAIYLGRIGGGGDVTELSICDVAEIEFSLLPVAGWKPWGVLESGSLTITHPEEGTTIEITEAKNGPSNAPIVLTGGPYRVWVDWRPSRFSSEQHRENLERVRQRILDGEIESNDHAVQLIEKKLAREPGPWIQSSGFHSRPRR